MTRPARLTAVIALAAIASVAMTYAGTGRLGFFWDDYLLLRPRPWAELLRVWHGSWDTTGVVPAFYRPLAVWADTAAFMLFGFNEQALRIAALVQLATGAWLIGEFVRREVTSTTLGVFAAAAYAAHPAVSASAGPWWFEQNHRLAVICVAAALLCWQSRRDRSTWRAWWPVHVWILAGSLFKEDVLTLAPLLFAMQWWRARTIGDGHAPSRRLIATTGAVWAAWFGVRWWLLGTVAGRPIGGADGTLIDLMRHAARGIWDTFLRIRPMQDAPLLAHHAATLVLALAWIAGAWISVTGASARGRLLIGYGLLCGAAFNILLIIASYPTRYQLLALGAVLMLTGILAAWRDNGASVARRMSVAAGVVLILSLSAASRASVGIYRPCTTANLQLDVQLRSWLERTPAWRHSWILPWLDVKAARCAEGRDVPITEAIPDVLRAVQDGRQ